MVTLLDWPTGTIWNHNLVSLWANLRQYRLANKRVSPSETDWPIKWCSHANQVGQWGTYLWSHATPVGQSIIVPIPIRLANGVPICGPTPVGQSIIVPISIRVANGVLICGPIQHRLANQSGTMIDWPTGVAWDHKYVHKYPIGQPDWDGDNA